MRTYIDGEYKITELDSGAIIKEINTLQEARKPVIKPGADLDLDVLGNTEIGKAVIIILKHMNLI